MTLNKTLITVFFCSLQLIASNDGGEKEQPTPNLSRSSTPELATSNGSYARRALNTVSTPIKKTASFLFDDPQNPAQKPRTPEELNVMLGGGFAKRIIKATFTPRFAKLYFASS